MMRSTWREAIKAHSDNLEGNRVLLFQLEQDDPERELLELKMQRQEEEIGRLRALLSSRPQLNLSDPSAMSRWQLDTRARYDLAAGRPWRMVIKKMKSRHRAAQHRKSQMMFVVKENQKAAERYQKAVENDSGYGRESNTAAHIEEEPEFEEVQQRQPLPQRLLQVARIERPPPPWRKSTKREPTTTRNWQEKPRTAAAKRKGLDKLKQKKKARKLAAKAVPKPKRAPRELRERFRSESEPLPSARSPSPDEASGAASSSRPRPPSHPPQDKH